MKVTSKSIMLVGLLSRYLSRLYLHKQSVETPTHVDSPPLLNLYFYYRFEDLQHERECCKSVQNTNFL